jgi:hypothetical protein
MHRQLLVAVALFPSLAAQTPTSPAPVVPWLAFARAQMA